MRNINIHHTAPRWYHSAPLITGPAQELSVLSRFISVGPHIAHRRGAWQCNLSTRFSCIAGDSAMVTGASTAWRSDVTCLSLLFVV